MTTTSTPIELEFNIDFVPENILRDFNHKVLATIVR